MFLASLLFLQIIWGDNKICGHLLGNTNKNIYCKQLFFPVKENTYSGVGKIKILAIAFNSVILGYILCIEWYDEVFFLMGLRWHIWCFFFTLITIKVFIYLLFFFDYLVFTRKILYCWISCCQAEQVDRYTEISLIFSIKSKLYCSFFKFS